MKWKEFIPTVVTIICLFLSAVHAYKNQFCHRVGPKQVK